MRHSLLVAAALLFAASTPVLAAEKPPTYTFDPYRKTLTITGQPHWHNALLDLNKWAWYFSIAIIDGEAHNPVLIVDSDLPDWKFFDHAADIDGNELKVIQGAQDVELDGVHEAVGIEIPTSYIRDHRSTGMNIKLMGERGDIVLQVPAEAVTTFADGAIAISNKLQAERH